MSKANTALGDGPVAHVLLRGRQGVFVADVCELVDGVVSATGRSRWRTGANFEDFRWGQRASFSWPLREIREIEWLDGSGASE